MSHNDLKSGGIEQKGSDKKIQIPVDRGNPFAKLTRQSIDELQSTCEGIINNTMNSYS